MKSTNTYYSVFLISILFTLSLNSANAQEGNSEELIRKELSRQQACWNNGDIECFMAGYWNSEELRFLGKSGLNKGWQQTFDNYIKSYPDRAAMGKLHFELLHFKELGEINYLVTGKWELTRESDKPWGYFTLIWEKLDGKWNIVYDHSSSGE